MQTSRRDTWTPQGKAPPQRPALKPYWGKPAVRNFRGDDGNVGIIRSPVRAIALPDKLPEADGSCDSTHSSLASLAFSDCWFADLAYACDGCSVGASSAVRSSGNSRVTP